MGRCDCGTPSEASWHAFIVYEKRDDETEYADLFVCDGHMPEVLQEPDLVRLYPDDIILTDEANGVRLLMGWDEDERRVLEFTVTHLRNPLTSRS